MKFRVSDEDFEVIEQKVKNVSDVWIWSEIVHSPIKDGVRDCFADIQNCKPDPLQKTFGRFLNPEEPVSDDDVVDDWRRSEDDLMALGQYLEFCDEQREVYNLDENMSNKEVIDYVGKNLSEISNDWKNSGLAFEDFAREYLRDRRTVRSDDGRRPASVDRASVVDSEAKKTKGGE